MPSPRINDLPEEERPREKLSKWGAASLSNAELIAIFLRVGVKGKSAIQVAQELLDTHGNLRNLGKSSVKEIAKQHGIGNAKAAQIAAAFELGVRSAQEHISNASIASAAQVYHFLKPVLNHQKHEKLFLLLCDSRLKHQRTIPLSHGTLNETICHPRDVLHPVVLHEAWGFILVHNHPTGDPSPSRADEQITEKIHKAADLLQVRFVDHVIVGSPSTTHAPYYSFREHELLD